MPTVRIGKVTQTGKGPDPEREDMLKWGPYVGVA